MSKHATKRSIHSPAISARKEIAAAEGPNPAHAVADALSAANALAAMGMWLGPRDPASEAALLVVRQRWARIQRKAKRDWPATDPVRKERPHLSRELAIGLPQVGGSA